ncbi:hypothetical protein MM221_13040 [Salipaludibacillus sp. LMS25]|uniref:hypothetical protein n=1 Tax=Salipaludibacillus sp. LMS25 TaxID=2924031 RepID=UPI0020D156D9|nr:hypothetical protein [Salipaludibacillus sp. LMS25]UTR13548.1 hypothetical protein MM221_13040 [Salipaludibacillus sp. LMS25]
MSWEEYQENLHTFCEQAGLPTNAQAYLSFFMSGPKKKESLPYPYKEGIVEVPVIRL